MRGQKNLSRNETDTLTCQSKKNPVGTTGGASKGTAKAVDADRGEETVAQAAYAAGQSIVELLGIEKSFPGVRALQNVSFDLRPGEVHALMGENGAGKSTLMKILTGVYQPDGGDIRVDGDAVTLPDPQSAQALGISIIHQELFLMNHLTVAQNIFIGREPRKGFGIFVDEGKLKRDAAAIFARMKVKIDPAAEVGHLTVAKQQLVEIAKALSYNARVLVMDEPTSALNETEVEHLFAVIDDLKANGVGIVYITHKMDEVKRIADRVTVMRDGQYIDTLPAADTPMSKIIQLMVGRELADQHRATGQGTEDEVLRVEGLKGGPLVRNVSFSVNRGEILGFAGLMGAGRTEVARAIFGADPISAGTIHVHGRARKIGSPADAVANGIAYLSEDRKHFGLVTGMSVRDNVTMASWGRFMSGGFMQDAALGKVAEDYVKKLRVKTPHIHQETRLLSGGNQQKVVIAKWLLRDCDILIFDEPTRGIDVGAKAEIYRLLEELAAAGKAIIVISSELPEVLRLSHRIAVMCEGRITGELDGRTATQEDIMTLATQRANAA